MAKFIEYIGFQFGNPKGVIGRVCCKIMNIINKKMYGKLIEQLNLDDKGVVLEIGYGNGYLIDKIYKNFKATIYGIDISNDAKKLAENRNKKIPTSKLFLDIGDCCKLKYNDNKFDSIVTINTIYFWSNTEKGLKEIFRTLKPNGIFYNVVYSKSWLKKLSYTKKGFKLFESDEYVDQGKKAGFTSVKLIEIVKNKSFIVEFTK